MPQTFGEFIVLGLVFGLLASACAFVIAYASYQNQFMDSRTHVRLALHTAGVTFIFFLVACAALPWVFALFQHLGQ